MPEQYEVSPLKLWSPLDRQLAACGQKRGTSEQWIGTIRNLQKKSVSAAEIEGSEIIPFLESHTTAQLYLTDLLAFLRSDPPCELFLQRHIVDDFAPIVRYVKQPRPDPLPKPSLRRCRREICLLQYKDLSFGICVWLHVEVDRELTGERFKYWTVTVPRGKKHPLANLGGRGFVSTSAALSHGRELIQRMAHRLASRGFVGPAKTINQYAHWVLAGGNHYTEWLITAPNFNESYFGQHFDIRNLIAHVRTTERITTEGDRLLVMEETQSDWNQTLREFELAAKKKQTPATEPHDLANDLDDEPPASNPYRHHWLDAALRMMLLLATHKGFAGIAWLPGPLHTERFPWANGAGLAAFYDQVVSAAIAKLGKSWGAVLDEAQFTTYSRQYRVGKVAKNGAWRVTKTDFSSIFDEEFPEYAKAEEFRLTKENPVMENIPVLYISDQMRADIKANGLPCIGAIGRRDTSLGVARYCRSSCYSQRKVESILRRVQYDDG